MLFCAITSLVVLVLFAILVLLHLSTIAGNQVVADKNAGARDRMILDALKRIEKREDR
jgi:hypothetical protein